MNVRTPDGVVHALDFDQGESRALRCTFVTAGDDCPSVKESATCLVCLTKGPSHNVRDPAGVVHYASFNIFDEFCTRCSSEPIEDDVSYEIVNAATTCEACLPMGPGLHRIREVGR